MLSSVPMDHRGYTMTAVSRINNQLVISTNRKNAAASPEGQMGTIILTPIQQGVVRVQQSEREKVIPMYHYSLENTDATELWSYQEYDNHVVLYTDELQLHIDKGTCAFTWRNATGELLVGEPKEGGKRITEIDVEHMNYEHSEAYTEKSVDGLKARSGEGQKVFHRKGYRTRLKLNFAEDEALYGLGQHEDGILNYRYQSQQLYQINMKVAVPMLVSSKGYGLYFDTHALSTFDGDQDGGTFQVDVAEALDFFFIHGPEFDDIIGHIRELTGDMPMLPRWACGFVQSLERYETAQELVDVVSEYRDRQVPIDCIVLDWSSWVDGQWGQKTLDPQRFPDPKQLTQNLHDLNARLMVSIWPNMEVGCPNHKEMKEAGYLLANDSNYDAFNQEARKMYWRQANEGLFSHGVDAWWCDSTEPFNADWNGTEKLPTWQRVYLNTEESKKYVDPAVINAFSLLHSKGIYEGQRATSGEKRVINLTRSGGMGQQRYGTITWSGDIEARWSRMRKQIADGLNFTVTGNPRWSFDIGAFFVKPSVQWFWDGVYPEGNNDLGYRELYTRWYQMGALMPLFRSHGTDTRREIWRFGEPGDVFYDTIKKYTELRYRLLPSIYSLAALEVFERYTTLRNLAFDFRHDGEAINIDDQYMFGPNLLVCPVTQAMYYEANSVVLNGVAKTRDVYLPVGCDWYDFWSGQHYEGGQWISAHAPIEQMPLFVRTGSVVLMGPIVQHSDEGLEGSLEIRIYPGADGSFVLYEDEGDNYNYENGQYCWTLFEWNDRSGELTVHAREGEYAEQLHERVLNVVLVQGQVGIGLLESGDQVIQVTYAGESIIVQCR